VESLWPASPFNLVTGVQAHDRREGGIDLLRIMRHLPPGIPVALEVPVLINYFRQRLRQLGQMNVRFQNGGF
jgi:hypothetical protein